ncbi:MAG: beta-galactosidase [Planctomycetota bacterium]|jgi:beta-galactosidase GanA
MEHFPDITIGVQYYRQPTPLPGEWDGDLANIRKMGFDVIQLRPQWRWHERNEGELDFDDLDRLFDLAAKHGLKVLFKFYLPAGPEWLFDRYDAYRVRPNGELMRPVSIGSVYVGGLAPCFDKDIVRRKANRFIRAAVRRYRERPNLIAWHAWNEPRSRPADDCACADSMAGYRAWLKDRFGTIEAFNDFTGLVVSGKGPDFGAVKAPVNPGDYAGWLLFRTWRAAMVADRLKWVRDEIRKLDGTRPIICHAGFCSALQDAFEDVSNDYLNAQPFDVFGSSCPNRPDDLPLLAEQPIAYEAATVDLICSRLRGVKDPFWMNEIYGNYGMYAEDMPPSYFRQTTYHTIASGAKGVVYWQYRSERLSSESNDAGLTKINGEPTDRSREVARINQVLKAHQKLLGTAKPPQATVGILYDFSSDLISRIATGAPGPVVVPPGVREDYPYKASLRGIHLAFWELDIPADVVPSEEYERLTDYPVVYLPCPRMIPPAQVRLLARYVREGGLLICEPSPGMRDLNGWAAPDVPPAPLDELFGCRESLRVKLQRRRVLTTRHGRITCPPGVFLTRLALNSGAGSRRGVRVAGSWAGGGAGVVSRADGGGRAVLLGAPLGEVYFRTRAPAVLKWVTGTLAESGIRPERLLTSTRPDLRVRRLIGPDRTEVLFVFNYRAAAARVGIRGRGMRKIAELSDLGVRFTRARGGFSVQVPPQEVLIARLSK